MFFSGLPEKGNPGQMICNQKLWIDSLTLPKKPTKDILLDQWFSIRSDFVPQGTFGNAWKHFLVVTLGEDAAGI